MFGPSTRAAVEAFQRRRGLRIDGIVTQTTWDLLVEAGWRLGDRVLSTTAPLPRGDDVAELQERLAALGFDPGRVDGIYGAQTRAALASFQRDAGLSADGIAGPGTVLELRRLAPRHHEAPLVSEVKERSRLERGATLEDLTIAIGHAGGLDAVVEASSSSLHARGAGVVVLRDAEESALPAAANDAKAACLLVLRLDPGSAGPLGLYFATERSESPAGRRLAETVAQAVGRALGVAHATRGMSLPVLRETQMPTAVLELGPLDRLLERSSAIAEGIAAALEQWAEPAGELS